MAEELVEYEFYDNAFFWLFGGSGWNSNLAKHQIRKEMAFQSMNENYY